jgi:hypothetical protein
MMAARADEILRSLHAFTGGTAQFWDYAATHGTLVIELVSPAKARGYLVLTMCEEISSPTFWRQSNPEIIVGHGWMELTDDRIRIRCQEMALRPHNPLET